MRSTSAGGSTARSSAAACATCENVFLNKASCGCVGSVASCDFGSLALRGFGSLASRTLA